MSRFLRGFSEPLNTLASAALIRQLEEVMSQVRDQATETADSLVRASLDASSKAVIRAQAKLGAARVDNDVVCPVCDLGLEQCTCQFSPAELLGLARDYVAELERRVTAAHVAEALAGRATTDVYSRAAVVKQVALGEYIPPQIHEIPAGPEQRPQDWCGCLPEGLPQCQSEGSRPNDDGTWRPARPQEHGGAAGRVAGEPTRIRRHRPASFISTFRRTIKSLELPDRSWCVALGLDLTAGKSMLDSLKEFLYGFGVDGDIKPSQPIKTGPLAQHQRDFKAFRLRLATEDDEVVIVPELLSKLSVYAGFRKRDPNLLLSLKGHAITWCKEWDISWAEAQTFVMPCAKFAWIPSAQEIGLLRLDFSPVVQRRVNAANKHSTGVDVTGREANLGMRKVAVRRCAHAVAAGWQLASDVTLPARRLGGWLLRRPLAIAVSPLAGRAWTDPIVGPARAWAQTVE